MSRRRAHTDATQALAVRQLQEQAARLEVQSRRQTMAMAETRLREQKEEHLRRQLAWATALEGSLDVQVVGLWRAHSEAALNDVRDHERAVEHARQDLSDAGDNWALQMRLAEAAGRIAHQANRNMRRADDERRLAATEDARLGQRGVK